MGGLKYAEQWLRPNVLLQRLKAKGRVIMAKGKPKPKPKPRPKPRPTGY